MIMLHRVDVWLLFIFLLIAINFVVSKANARNVFPFCLFYEGGFYEKSMMIIAVGVVYWGFLFQLNIYLK